MPRLAPDIRTQRRQRLVDAAWRCVSRKGFQTLTVDDVCAEAGVSKGTFYVYFDQKQDLLFALLDDDSTWLHSTVEGLRRAPGRGIDRLRELVREMLERGADRGRLQVRADLWAEMSANPALRDRLAESVAGRRAALREWLEEIVGAGEMTEMPANAFAAIILALGDGLMLQAGVDPDGFRWENVRKALDVILDGLRR